MNNKKEWINQSSINEDFEKAGIELHERKKLIKIICSAIWYDDGKIREHNPPNIKIGIVVFGFRHSNCFYYFI